ncbi:MAG: cytochrome C oxidase subunit IV family protein [Planctomycetota bacterium]|jgi:cytochrome c oxidase subunit 4|nr:cytochrome C oxidase subunit IV family protein [Planctomycetota bacterium]
MSAPTADHTSDSHDHGHGHDGDFSHPMPIWMLLAVFFALLLLTVATVYQSTFSLGNLEVWMSLAIATVKAGLVIAFFMHLLWDKPLNAIIIFSSLIFVALFLGFTMMDAQGYRENLIMNPALLEDSQPAAVKVELSK